MALISVVARGVAELGRIALILNVARYSNYQRMRFTALLPWQARFCRLLFHLLSTCNAVFSKTSRYEHYLWHSTW